MRKRQVHTSSAERVLELEQLLAEERAKNIALNKRIKSQDIVFNTILDATLAGYWDWYIQDNYEYLSPTFKKMFGYEDHEMENSPEAWQKIIHPDDLQIVYKVFDRHIGSKGEIPYDSTVRYYHKDGSIVWVFCRGQVIEWDAEGKPLRMIGCHVDITELKKMENLEERYLTLKGATNEFDEFIKIASHNLQEPILKTIHFSKKLKEKNQKEFDELSNKLMDYILDSTTFLQKQIFSLVEYYKLGRDKFEVSDVDINALVKDILFDFNAQIKEKEVKVITKGLPKIRGDQRLLRVLFWEIIHNALKFTKEGVSPEISIISIEDEENWSFFLEDNGIGITPQHQTRIFRIFDKVNTFQKSDGIGLGLSKCRKVVELHEGTIQIDSNQGRTVLTVVLPKKRNNKN